MYSVSSKFKIWPAIVIAMLCVISCNHYSDVIMSVMASQITGVSIDCSAVCSGTDQRKHQSSTSLAFVRGIHCWPKIQEIFLGIVCAYDVMLIWGRYELTHCGLVTKVWDYFGLDNGLLPDGSKLVPEPMLTNHQWGAVAFIWGQFQGNTQIIYPLCKFEYC